MAEVRYTIMMAEKRHDPRQCHPKHLNRNSLPIGNIRLLKGRPAVVSEWWFLKNMDYLKQLVAQEQIVIKRPDGSMMGDAPVAEVSPPQPEVPVISVPEPVVLEEVAKPEPEPEPEPEVVEDDFSLLPLKDSKIKRLQSMAKTFADIVQLGMDGLVEAGLTPAQAEKTLEFAQSKVG